MKIEKVSYKTYLRDAENGKKTLFVYGEEYGNKLEFAEVVWNERPEGYDMPRESLYLIVHTDSETDSGYVPSITGKNAVFYRIFGGDRDRMEK